MLCMGLSQFAAANLEENPDSLVQVNQVHKYLEKFFGSYRPPANLEFTSAPALHIEASLIAMDPNSSIAQITDLENGDVLVSGCRIHECMVTKAALVMDKQKYVFLRSEDRDSENVKALRKWIADVDGPNRLIYRQIKP